MVSLKVSEVAYNRKNYGLKSGNRNNVSFGLSAAKAAKAVSDPLDDLNFFTRFNSWYNKNNEIKTILFTALGTGIIAPIVLTINPIAKEDEKTKKYTALRQPLSAGLAVITQVGINTPIPKMIDRLLVLKGKMPFYYLPDPNKIGKEGELEARHYKAEDIPVINKRYEEALKDDKFKENLANFIYKSKLQEIRVNAVKDVSYIKRFFNPQVRAEIKKQIEEKSKTIKKLAPDEITIKQAIEYASGNLKTFKNLVGITASVAVLYPTFTFLNWIYPRFVEMFFPHLVKDKAGDEPVLSPASVTYMSKNAPFPQAANNGKAGV